MKLKDFVDLFYSNRGLPVHQEEQERGHRQIFLVKQELHHCFVSNAEHFANQQFVSVDMVVEETVSASKLRYK